jgi:hypothetical protein
LPDKIVKFPKARRRIRNCSVSTSSDRQFKKLFRSA